MSPSCESLILIWGWGRSWYPSKGIEQSQEIPRDGDVISCCRCDGVFTRRAPHATHSSHMKLFNAIATAAVIGISFVAAAPAQAKGNCTFTETSGKTIVQSAAVHGAMGNIWIEWGDGGKTTFMRLSNGSFRDDGDNIWDLNEHRGARLQMRRADGASMSCFSPW